MDHPLVQKRPALQSECSKQCTFSLELGFPTLHHLLHQQWAEVGKVSPSRDYSTCRQNSASKDWWQWGVMAGEWRRKLKTCFCNGEDNPAALFWALSIELMSKWRPCLLIAGEKLSQADSPDAATTNQPFRDEDLAHRTILENPFVKDVDHLSDEPTSLGNKVTTSGF